MLILVVGFGDLFDVLGYAVLWCYLPRLERLLVAPGDGAMAGQVLLWVTSHAVILGALDRVYGYPDQEITPLLMMCAWGLLSVGILGLSVSRGTQRKTALVCGAMLALPVIEAPIVLARQVGASFAFVDAATEDRDWFAATRIGWKQGVAIGPCGGALGSPERLCALIFTRQGGRYTFHHQVWLLDGGGSMDAQRPNLPWLLRPLVLR
jgi:hypothetical protein